MILWPDLLSFMAIEQPESATLDQLHTGIVNIGRMNAREYNSHVQGGVNAKNYSF